MKYNYIVLMLFLLWGAGVKAQYTSKSSYTGNYEDASTWAGSQPPANGDVRQSLYINGTVERTGNMWVRDGIVYGTLNVNGTFNHNNGAQFHIANGGRLEIWGDLWATQVINVNQGGTLIVHGNLTVYNAGCVFSGNVVVTGNVYMRNTDVPASGNLVVGGNFTIPGGGGSVSGDIYVLDPDANVNVPGWMPVSPGDETDFTNNESGNSNLNDAVKDAGLVSKVDAPNGFTFGSLSGTSADLSWLLNADGDDVMIALYSSDTDAKPVDGTAYTAGQTLSDNAEIIYVGSGGATSFNYNGFTEGASNYVRIWSVNGSNEYSKAVKLVVKTLSSNVIFYEDFESGNAKSWTLGRNGGSGNEWIIGSAESYNGSAAAYISNDGGSTSGYNSSRQSTIYLQNDITIPSTYKSAELSFYWKGIGEDGYDGGSVRENRSTQLITDASLNNQATWVEENIDITSYIGSKFDLDFRWYNDWNAGQNPGFAIDEVRVIGSEVARPRSFSGNVISSDQVDLSWQKSVDNDNVIIA
ncbi:MAG: hypothetical protein MI866_01330, partial [Bacteroidales bacterium]|nr:hypothetical protein [Bacteroidales bacterium]